MTKSILGLVWSPPKPMRYKLNFDGVVFAEQNAARARVIIRNEETSHGGYISTNAIPFHDFGG